MFYIVVGIIILIVVTVVVYFVSTYNEFIVANNSIKEAFSTMDVYLKKRWDLIPNLVETVKGYMTHEKETLEEIVRLRASSYDNMDSNAKISANEQMSGAVTKILALSENYPELKSNQNFIELNTQIQQVEEEIANSRKYYNAVIEDYNNKVQMFPSNIIASIFGFKTKEMFEITDAQRENVKISF